MSVTRLRFLPTDVDPAEVLDRLNVVTDVSGLPKDTELVVEAVPELADVKAEVLADAEQAVSPRAIRAVTPVQLSVGASSRPPLNAQNASWARTSSTAYPRPTGLITCVVPIRGTTDRVAASQLSRTVPSWQRRSPALLVWATMFMNWPPPLPPDKLEQADCSISSNQTAVVSDSRGRNRRNQSWTGVVGCSTASTSASLRKWASAWYSGSWIMSANAVRLG